MRRFILIIMASMVSMALMFACSTPTKLTGGGNESGGGSGGYSGSTGYRMRKCFRKVAGVFWWASFGGAFGRGEGSGGSYQQG